MNLKYRISFLVVGLVLIVLTTSLIGRVVSGGGEQFFIMAMLGKDKMMGDYYPNSDPDVEVNSSVLWNIVVHNNMGGAQYVSIRVKVLNLTMQGPGALSPSPTPVLLEFRNSLADNQTVWIPFNWSILEITHQGDSVVIKKLIINGVPYIVDVGAVSGFNFRFIFELWYSNAASQNFEFTWRSAGEERCVWNQLWFNATAS